jgi:hypothetical protein
MMRRVVFALAAAAVTVLALAGAGSSRSAKVIQLSVSDGFTVKGTHILCEVETSKTLIPGVKVIGCIFANRSGAVPKTYEVALGVNGEVALARAQKGAPATVILRRKLSVVSAHTPRLYLLAPGDGATVNETAITCAVGRQKFSGKPATAVACFKVGTSGKPRPNSYGMGITDGGAFLVHFDAKSKGSPIKVVLHGK